MSRPDILQAALDVAIERMCRFHPDRQVFIFGPQGEPFWAKEAVDDAQLADLRGALALIAAAEGTRQRPFTTGDRYGRFTVFALDSEGELYAVVLRSPRPGLPGEARDRRGPRESAAQRPGWLKINPA